MLPSNCLLQRHRRCTMGRGELDHAAFGVRNGPAEAAARSPSRGSAEPRGLRLAIAQAVPFRLNADDRDAPRSKLPAREHLVGWRGVPPNEPIERYRVCSPINESVQPPTTRVFVQVFRTTAALSSLEC